MATTESYSPKERDEKYNNWARRRPAVINLAFPLFLILYFFFNDIISNETELIKICKIVLYFGSIIPALFFLFEFLFRETAIVVVENLLSWCKGEPDIKLMLKNDETMSSEKKEKIKTFIKKDFDIDLSKQPDKSNKVDFKEYKKRLGEAATQIKEKTRSNNILFEFNCIYGFFRNLCGGLIWNIVIALVSLVIYLHKINICLCEAITLNDVPGGILFWSMAFLFILFLLCLCYTYSSKKRYARRLYDVYISIHATQGNSQ